MRIELHIERLVLDGVGVEPHHADAVREAVEAELSRLLADVPAGWSSPQDRRLHRVVTPPVRLPAGRDTTAVGRGIARSVYGGVAAAAQGGPR